MYFLYEIPSNEANHISHYIKQIEDLDSDIKINVHAATLEAVFLELAASIQTNQPVVRNENNVLNIDIIEEPSSIIVFNNI